MYKLVREDGIGFMQKHFEVLNEPVFLIKSVHSSPFHRVGFKPYPMEWSLNLDLLDYRITGLDNS